VARLVDDARVFVGRLAGREDAALRARPEPDVWSPLEYACHVRDMLNVQRDRVELVARTETPELTPMGRDERVVEDRYNEQDPAVVTAAVVDAAGALAAALQAIDDAGWRRTAIYTYPERAVRSVEWIGTHTVHELEHHSDDVGRDRTVGTTDRH